MIEEIKNIGALAEMVKELLDSNLGKAEDFIIHESKENDD